MPEKIKQKKKTSIKKIRIKQYKDFFKLIDF